MMQYRLLRAAILLFASSVSGAELTLKAGVRADFLRVEAQAKQGNGRNIKTFQQQHPNYPLTPYLTANLLAARPQQFSISQARTFLNQHKNWPFYQRTRIKWLSSLPARGRWKTLAAELRPADPVALRCQLLRRPQARRSAAWSTAVSKVWLSATSLPKACNPLFASWRKQGQRTASLLWRRLERALEAHNYRLAKFLRRQLPAREQRRARQLARQWRHPDNVSALIRLYRSQKLTPEHKSKLVSRYLWAAPEAAVAHWSEIFSLDPTHSTIWRRDLALALVTKNSPDASTWLKNFADTDLDQTLRHWLLTALISTGMDRQAQRRLEHWSKQYPDVLGYRYWLARIYARNGQAAKAERLFRALATRQHYYGFLSAARLGLPASLRSATPLATATELAMLNKRPEIRRAREWLALKRRLKAKREWLVAEGQFKAEHRLSMATLANQLGFLERSIFLLGRPGFRDQLRLRFPVAFNAEFRNASELFDLKQSFGLAVTRQESAFQADAHSGAGAYGLMQLMPSTARRMARRNHLRYRGTASLSQPEVNIPLGYAHLRELFDRFNANPILATAAYNAGPAAVSRWLQHRRNIASDLWIEMIPYAETRDYVKQVLAYQLIYARKLGDGEPMLYSTIAGSLQHAIVATNSTRGEDPDLTLQTRTNPNTAKAK